MPKKVTVFVSEHCAPCQEIKRLLKSGDFLVNDQEGHEVDMVDIETEEGFTAMVSQGVAGVPSAYRDNKQCSIKVDEEGSLILLECPDGDKE